MTTFPTVIYTVALDIRDAIARVSKEVVPATRSVLNKCQQRSPMTRVEDVSGLQGQSPIQGARMSLRNLLQRAIAPVSRDPCPQVDHLLAVSIDDLENVTACQR